jgi:DNA-binding transcriptional LysR family regulator
MPKMEQLLHALPDMALFVEVARTGSFRQAAARLQLPPSTLSRRIAAMEARLGVKLLLRTTRSVGLTPAAQPFYAQCLEVLDAAQRAQALLADSGQPRQLRIAMPVDLGVDVLGTIIADFAAARPGLQIDMALGSRAVDLLREPVDLAFRIGQPLDERIVARKLADILSGLYASPGFMAQHGPIRQPAQLAGLPCLDLRTALGSMPWQIGEQAWPGAPGPCRLAANNVALLCRLAEAGHGIALLPQHVARPRGAQPLLLRVRPQASAPVWPLYAVSAGRQLPPLVQALISHVRDRRDPHYLAPAVPPHND